MKDVQNLKWSTVPVEGFPASLSGNFEGFIGLEECKDYGGVKNSKTHNKKNIKKRKAVSNGDQKVEAVTIKKTRLSNGFVVESCQKAAPSLSNEEKTTKRKKKKKKMRNDNKNMVNGTEQNAIKKQNKSKNVDSKKIKPKLGENMAEINTTLTPDDMLSWAEFKLPNEIMTALTELGFEKPTKIQQLSLPAAIHGRRDILGAAETGSGKTLAFGLPILSGILKLKEKAETKGLDVYDIPYKKSSVKRKNHIVPETKQKIKSRKQNNRKNQQKAKESSEDGYSSDDGNVEDTDYIEEVDVPLRKKESLADEGNESDNSEDFVHLSEMHDSEDLNDASDTSDAVDESAVEEGSDNDDQVEEEEDLVENESDGHDEIDANQEGIGCVNVIDNIEIPGHVVTKTGKPLYALILTPTRELAVQISRHLIAVAKYTGIRIATIIGGMAAVKQERVLKYGPEVVVATPGRLWELINQGEPHLQQLHSVKFLAIDETDRMIERGHFEELHPLLERLNVDEERRSTRQNFVFSATLTLVHDLPAHMKGKKVTKRGKIIKRNIEKMTPQQKIKRLVDMIGMTNPKVVDITTHNLGTAETLTECRIACSLKDKDVYLYYILKRHPGRTIVFCNSIGCVKRLSQLLSILSCNPLPLHACMQQRQRLKNLERFRDNPLGVLIATDVAARGLDIPNVDHVIHFQVPKTAESYIHRSGRTARASKEGLTILMMEPSEAYSYGKLCRTLNKTAELPTFPVPPQSLAPIREIMAIAVEIDALILRKRRVAQSQGWKEKAAKDIDMIIDDDDCPTKESDPYLDKVLQARKNKLETVLSRPLFPKNFSFKYPTLNDPNALVVIKQPALKVMKDAIESGALKKEKRKTKNESLLKLEKKYKKK